MGEKTYPYYLKHEIWNQVMEYIKVIAPKKFLTVSYNKSHSIIKTYNYIPMVAHFAKESHKMEFDKVYNKAIQQITQ